MTKRVQFGVALAAAVLVSGCGGSSTSTSSKPPTKTAAVAAAAGINLQTADLPAGYTGAPHDSSSDSSSDDAAFATCAGASPPNGQDVADEYSQDFSKGQQIDMSQVSSEVDVVKSASTAKQDLAAFQSDKTTACLATFVTKLVTRQAGGTPGVTFDTPKVSKVPVKADGTEGGFGYTVRLDAKASGLTIPFEISIRSFLVKHSEISLTTLSLGHPFPASDRDALFAKLLERAKKSAV
jgi:hypothetical protein